MTAERAYDRGFDDGYDGYAADELQIPEPFRADYLRGFSDGEIESEREGVGGFADDAPAFGVDAAYFARELAP